MVTVKNSNYFPTYFWRGEKYKYRCFVFMLDLVRHTYKNRAVVLHEELISYSGVRVNTMKKCNIYFWAKRKITLHREVCHFLEKRVVDYKSIIMDINFKLSEMSELLCLTVHYRTMLCEVSPQTREIYFFFCL